MFVHPTRRTMRHLPIAALAALLLVSAGCSNNDDDRGDDASGETVSGTAAVGLPIAGGAVSVKCQAGSAPASTNTGTNGGYTITVPASNFPCVLRVSGGTVNGAPNTQNLHSLATGGGIANITPLTDLALALSTNTAVGTALAAWFDAPANWSTVAANLSDALDTLREALIDAGYDVPSSWTAGSTAPLSGSFTPDPANDAFDALLEALAEAIENSGVYADYDALLAAFASGGVDLPEAEEPTAPGTELPAPTGTGAALDGSDGATGTLAGTTYTYKTNPGWSSQTRAFMVYGSPTDAVSRWALQDVPASVGTHYCKTNDLLPRIQLVVGGGTFYDTAPNGGACRIEVQSVTDNTITGRFSATLVDMQGAVVGTVTDGYFRVSPSTGGGGTLPAGEIGASFKMNGSPQRYTRTLNIGGHNFIGLTLGPELTQSTHPAWPQGIQLHSMPRSTGTYVCDTRYASDLLKVNIWFYWNEQWYYAGNRTSNDPGPAGSSCTITLTRVDAEFIEGSFEGIFVTEDGSKSVTVSDGLFRYRVSG